MITARFTFVFSDSPDITLTQTTENIIFSLSQIMKNLQIDEKKITNIYIEEENNTQLDFSELF